MCVCVCGGGGGGGGGGASRYSSVMYFSPGQTAETLGQRVTQSCSLKDALEGAVYVQVRKYD